MSWKSGSILMEKVMNALGPCPDAGVRGQVYSVLIPAMGDMDWDNETDLIGRDAAYDQVVYQISRKYFDELIKDGAIERSASGLMTWNT